ncbi:MAG: hypothetical protein WC661_16680 [Opitutaceae bacterium]|jgi:hypothetical protein
MRRRPIIFREAPRFSPIRQRELRAGVRPIRRTVVVYGPVLSLVALWTFHHFAGYVPITRHLVTGLFLAPLSFALIFELPGLLSRIPALASLVLYTWRLTPHGVIQQGGLVTRGCPWTAIHALHIEETPDEITLRLDVGFRGVNSRWTLTCRRADVTAESLAVFTDAVSNQSLR